MRTVHKYLLADTEQRGRDAVLADVEALVNAEVSANVEANVRSEVAGVRCFDCNLRYEERQEYGCGESGRGHSYDAEEIADAEASARADASEWVTLSVAALRDLIAKHRKTDHHDDGSDR